jgi:hypothetical protein
MPKPKTALLICSLTVLTLAITACGGSDDAAVAPVSCPDDAKICEDGTVVARELPSCDFAACPVDLGPLDPSPEVGITGTDESESAAE